ncbi:MAG: Ig-like domain-containing protein [Christensenellales bacterium]
MKTRKTITLMLALLMVLAALPWQRAAALPFLPAYNLDDIAVINGIIDAHPELGWPKAPADGSSVPDEWTGKVSWMQMASRYVQKINLSGTGISGALKVNGLPVLQILYCNDNQLTGLDVSGLPYLVQLHCHHNFMADRSAVTGKEINWDGTNFIFDPQHVPLSFTAEQTGGANGTADSTGIKLTFDKDVTGLTADKITLTNGTGEASKGNLTGSGKAWNLALAQVIKPGDIYVSIANFGDYRVTGDARQAWVHKAGAPTTYTVTVTKGTASKSPALAGETVTLTADAAPGGQVFVEWNISPAVQFTGGTSKQSSTAKFIMPEENVRAEAIYAGEFNRADIAVINSIIAVNGWNVPKAPADGSSVPGEWNEKVKWTGDANNKRVYLLNLDKAGLTGTLDVSGLTALTYLYCGNNQLTGLNVSGLSALIVLYCNGNQLTGLNVGGLTALHDLRCHYNQLTELNVSGLTALQVLYCYDNQLTGLNVSGLSNLQQLYCHHNYMADRSAVTGREIDWDNTNFKFDPQHVLHSFTAEQTGGANGTADSTGIKLTFDKDITGLTADKITLTNGTGEASKGNLTGSGQTWDLAFAQVTKPGDIYVSIANFGDYRVTNNPQPVRVHKAGAPTYTVTVTGGTANGRSAVSAAKDAVISLTADATPGGQAFAEWNISPPVQFTDGTSELSSTAKFIMPEENVRAEAIYAGEFNRADIAVINSIIAVNGWKVPQAPADGSSVPDEWNGTVFWTDKATNKRVKKLTLISAGLTGTLDVRGLTALINLNCYGNQLTGLNVSDLPALFSLDCRSNQLKGLNVSGLKALNYLNCQNNQLTGLDVSSLPTTLLNLNCAINQLTGMFDVSGLPALAILNCGANQLTGLNVSGLSDFQSLSCNRNQLTELDVSGLSTLQELFCSQNQLTGLNVSGLSALQRLHCDKNQLSGLALNQDAPYRSINVKYNYMANEGAVTGRIINWDGYNFHFSPQYRRVSYDANGGSGIMNKDSAVDGVAFTLPENGFTAPLGQRFKAWAIGDVSGPQKKAGEQHTFNADTTLYAVWGPPVTGVSLNKTTATLTVGGSETLTATVAPADAANQNVTWSSDKPGVATVDQSGKVTAVAPGAATITVKTEDGGKTASCSVTVRQAAPFTGAVTFDKNTVKTGEPVTATWNLSGGVPPYSVSAYSWYVREEGSGTRILEKSGGAAAVGSLSFTPTKGEALMLELDLRDSADQIFSYSSDWIPISGGGSPDTAVKGDANGDNLVDIRDLVSIINYIVSGIQPKSTEGADANGDGDVDIRDLVWVIKLIVG